MKIDELNDGEWVRPKRSGWVHECCGCGLRHMVKFKLNKLNKKDHYILMQWNLYEAGDDKE